MKYKKYLYLGILLLGITLCFWGNSCCAAKYCKATKICSFKSIRNTNVNKTNKNKSWNPVSVAHRTNISLKNKGYTPLKYYLRQKRKNKKITNSIYKNYYPNAGAAYIKVYVCSNLYRNATEDGTVFKSSSDVVDYLTGIYQDLPMCSYYNVVYKKRVKKNKRYYYLFYLYNGYEK